MEAPHRRASLSSGGNVLPNCRHPPTFDPSNGYEHVAQQFLEHRRRSDVGATTLRTWGRSLPPNAAVLDLGCGSGVPISQALMDEGVAVYGVDSSPTLCAAFRCNLPGALVACECVEESEFFGRRFEGAVAWGLMFLLPAESQLTLVDRVARALSSRGHFLFTVPTQVCSWADVLTGRTSRSVGDAAYRAALEASGLSLVAEYIDEGENHYYDAAKR
jgi:SAM-dependent methyltransferase